MSDPGSPLPDPLAGGSALVLSLRWVPDPVPTQAPTSLAQATQNQAEHGLPQGPCRPALTAPPAIPLAGQASGVTELELDLAELGPVRMRIKDKRGRLALHVLADHPATLELLRRHADELTGSLREAGFVDTTLSWGSAKAGKDAEPTSSPERLADLSGAEIRAAAQDRDLYILL